MTFLDQFFDDQFDPTEKSGDVPASQDPLAEFESMSDDSLAEHLSKDTFGEFQLTNAVRPSLDMKIQPQQGYRHETYVDEENGGKVPVVMASASRENLFELFMQLIERLGQSVDVVLESSHARKSDEHLDLYREHIDMPVLKSILYDYEDLLMNDGCTGIAVLNPNTPQEIQFEEHKLLIIYGSPLEPYEFTLESNGIPENQDIKFITEAEHVHSTSDKYAERFNQLRCDLGLDGSQNQPESSQDYNRQEDIYGDADSWNGGDDACGGLM